MLIFRFRMDGEIVNYTAHMTSNNEIYLNVMNE